MPLFPVAPRIRARIPRALHAGDTFVAEILIDARAPVRLDWIDARLECVESWSIGSGDSSHGRKETLVALRARLFEPGTLPAGEHVYPVRFELPAAMPPSCELASAKVEALLSVEASVPWWPDARATFVVPVRGAVQPLELQPYRATNRAAGTDVPRVELSLASRVVAARGTVSGAIALFHHEPGPAKGVRLQLRAVTRLADVGGRVHAGGEIAWSIPLPDALPFDGTPIPFRVSLPAGVVPSFTSRSLALEWSVVLERRRALRAEPWLNVPIEVREPGDGGADPGALDVPPIGDPRLADELARAAAALGLGVDGAELVGTQGSVQLRISRDRRPDVGHALVAQLAFPRLGLGLTIERERWLTGLLQRDLQVGHPPLDDAYRIVARDADQTRAFMAQLAEPLYDGGLERLDDEGARIAAPDPELDTRSLIAFAERAAALSRLLDHARAGLVWPSGVQADRTVWSEVALQLGGRFVAGDLTVEGGSSGESPVHIETRLDTPRAEHVVRARPAPALPLDLALTVARPRAEAEALAATRGRALAGFLAALPDEARDLEIRDGEVSVRLPLALAGLQVRSDPRGALSVATLLAGLGARLAPARGPFR